MTLCYGKKLESYFIEVTNEKQKNSIAGVLYCHPCTDETNFIDDHIQQLNYKIQAENKNLFVAGDFNFDLLNLQHAETSSFFETMMSNHLMPTILLPTKINAVKHTVIDNIFTNQFNPDMKSGNFTITISDHLPSFLIMPKDNQNHLPKNQDIFVRDLNKFDKVNFTLDFLKIDWKEKLDRYDNDVNKACEFFHWKMNNLLDKYMPWKKLTNKEYKLRFKPWINGNILHKIKVKNRLFKQFTNCKDPIQKQERKHNYKLIKNEITALTRQGKKEYYHKYFTENKDNLKKIWIGIKEVINIKSKSTNKPSCIHENEQVLYNSKDIANSFNKYFSNIADDILNKRKYRGNTNYRKYLNNPLHKTFAAYPCDEKEVETIIAGLNPCKGTGPNSLPNNVLAMLKAEISIPLSIIFNISLSTGVYPDILKLSQILPIYKKDSKMEKCNYRPISLLSNINKIFEKLMYKRLYHFFESNKTIYSLQFGFRSKHSTRHALIEITEKIRCVLDKGETACGIFIDLQKAFDTVNHNILVNKLEYYGVRGTANNWFKSYLFNRTQYVSIEGFQSDMVQIKHGVPQGSVLGPLLFLVYINDLHKAIIHSKTYHFADDTHLLNISDSAKRIQKQVNIDLKCLYKWLLANKISLNCSKTELIIFQSDRSQETFEFNIKINGHKILPSDSIKYLGVYLDKNLSGKHHCKVLLGKLNRANGMLSKVRHYVPSAELKSIYSAIFSSHLTYNCQVWGQGNNPYLRKIEKAQNKAVRIIQFKEYNSPSKPLYISSGILKFNDQIKLENCLFVYDFLKNNLPDCFEDFFHKLSSVYVHHETRRSALGALFVPLTNTTKYGINSITYKSVQCWNHVTGLLKSDLTQLTRKNVKNKLVEYFKNELIMA